MRSVVLIAAAVGLLLPAVALAQIAQPAVQQRTVHLIEFDLPMNADAQPGAMIVDTRGDDNNRLWFVTRLGTPHVIRLSPQKSPMKGSAQFTSWEFAEGLLFAGGGKRLRASRDRRFVYLRTDSSLQRVDTQNCSGTPQTCQRINWADQTGVNVSDLAVDDLNRVFTTTAVNPDDPTTSYVQMLVPGTAGTTGATGTTIVTRWNVGGGAGFCPTAVTSGPCVSGIDVHPYNRSLVYYSEPSGNNIGELNVATNDVRRWSTLTVGASEPRQLSIDRWGIIWVVTGSGHLVRLDPAINKMSAHQIPNGALNDPFGVAPDDDVIGYTASGLNKVGMLLPADQGMTVMPTKANIPPGSASVPFTVEASNVATGSVPPHGKVAMATITSPGDGNTYVEAQLDSGGNDDQSPLGITPAKWRGQGTFFYAVGFNMQGADRVGFVRLPMPKKLKHPRDDDDTDDGCCSPTPPVGWHNSDIGDADDDGQGDEIDSPTANEIATIGDPAPLNPGQSVDYPVTASPTTLALLAMATADNVLGQITVEIYNAVGALVAGSSSAPGAATSTLALPAPGSYTVRVKNWGMSAISQTPTIVVKEPWLP